MFKFVVFLLLYIFLNTNSYSMEKKPYHHLPDGTFRNPEGSPERDPSMKWSYKIFNAERKKIKIEYPKSHTVPREQVLKDLQENKNNDYIAWIGHAILEDTKMLMSLIGTKKLKLIKKLK